MFIFAVDLITIKTNKTMVDAVLTINLESENREELVSKLEYITKLISEGYNFGEDWDIEIKDY